jgi:hypothetical protein
MSAIDRLADCVLVSSELLLEEVGDIRRRLGSARTASSGDQKAGSALIGDRQSLQRHRVAVVAGQPVGGT